MIVKKKNISKKYDFEKNIFEKLDFEWERFCKKHDFELKVLLRVRFWIRENTTRQFSIWIIYNLSDFECTSFAVCQVFLYSSKQSTFR